MRLGFDLKIEQSQKLVMTQELIQAIKILQLNTQELQSLVSEELMQNPLLEFSDGQDTAAVDPGNAADAGETGDGSAANEHAELMEGLRGSKARDRMEHELSDFDWKEQIRQSTGYDDISYRQWEYVKSERENEPTERFSIEERSLSAELLRQLDFAKISKKKKPYAEYIIESLDENGYLMETPEELSKELSIPLSCIKELIELIQGMEPKGVGAANLSECLLLQLSDVEEGRPKELAAAIIKDHLRELAENKLPQLAKELKAELSEIQEAADIIKGLEPKPGRGFSRDSGTRYVIPDVFVERAEEGYSVSINDAGSPHLMISSYYKGLLGRAEKDKDLEEYLSSKMESALWLIRSIEQRKNTIYRIAEAIVRYQKEFLEKGEKFMRPLTLKLIAGEAGVHESTVSRTVNGKYMETPRGVYELRDFFGSGVEGSDGEGVSAQSIKAEIREMVEQENPARPLSDQYMADKLSGKGIEISRRTVAKYRDEMGILSSSKRKRY